MPNSSFVTNHYRLPSAISPIKIANAPNDVSFWMKRDDLIHPFVSGNKLRKLQFVLVDALQKNAKILVTQGGAWSNHLLAVAVAGAIAGLKTAAFVRGNEARELSANLLLAKQFGMTLLPVSRTDYKQPEMLRETIKSTFEDSYWIGEGGKGELGELGVSTLVSEVNSHFSHWFTACGTGTTLSGLGAALMGTTTQLCGIAVLKNEAELLTCYAKNPINTSNFEIFTDYTFGGYAKINPNLLHFIELFQSENGILLDPVYTGKMVYAISDLCKKNYFTSGSKVLLLHTGGGLGTLGFSKEWQSLYERS